MAVVNMLTTKLPLAQPSNPRTTAGSMHITGRIKLFQSDDDNNNDNNDDDKERLLASRNTPMIPKAFQFLVSFWRGMTLPFPTLRNADNAPRFTVRECVFAILSYLSVGALAYTCIFERWTLVDALYFTVVSFSTVGYGDMFPTNLPSKLFTCIFGLGGVAFLGIAIATIGSALVEAELAATKKLGTKRFMTIFDNLPRMRTDRQGEEEVRNVVRNETMSSSSITSTTQQQRPSFWVDSLSKGLPKFLPSLCLLFFGGTMIGRMEGWSWFDSIYYSFITAGTLGYGDYSPKTPIGRSLAVIFLPVAVASAGELLGAISRILVARRQQIRNDQLLHRELDLAFLQEMDADGNGTVSRCEYITFMLQAMDVVDQDLLDELNCQFDALDQSHDGFLGVEDLKLMAQLSGRTVKSSL